MASNKPAIVNGMKVSAILPLGTADYVMALMYEHGGIELDVTPVIGAVFTNGEHHDPSETLALPAPAKRRPFSRDETNPKGYHAPLQQFIRKFFSSREEARFAEIADAAAAANVSSGSVGASLNKLIEDGFLKKMGIGLYRRNTKRPPKPQVRQSKLPLLLEVLAAVKDAHTSELQAAIAKRGVTMHPDAFHTCLNRARKDGFVERVALGTYRISASGKALHEGQQKGST